MADDKKAIEEWKRKYFDQLERLEKKEASWEQLEATLKRAIGRLSIAAEGQHGVLDGYIGNLRRSIKGDVNHRHLELIIDDISAILAQLEEKNSGPERAITSALLQLISGLSFADEQQKACKKIIKKLEKSDDSQRDRLLADTAVFLSSAISVKGDNTSGKPRFLSRVLATAATESKAPEKAPDEYASVDRLQGGQTPDISGLVSTLHGFFGRLPWPETEKEPLDAGLLAIKSAENIDQLQSAIHQLANIVSDWTSENRGGGKDSRFAIYKDCLMDLIESLDGDARANDFGPLKISVQLADEGDALEELTQQLSTLLLKSVIGPETDDTKHAQLEAGPEGHDESLQPTIQELFIRLLEQLIVPKSLEADADRVKKNLENKTHPADWKQLLKDVAKLINSIRLSMQAEKHEFEGFLQQVTDRLKDMDLFLQSETTKLVSAQNQGQQFDEDIQSNVNTIRGDINQATELPQLKVLVDKKLGMISEHINAYRIAEKKRASQSQENVESMQDRMQALEKETESLKKVIVEKNQQAMFDILTNVPNRFFYEQKMEEEFARWQRSHSPLTLTIWDIDLFKRINDSYGHKAGDKVLKTIAQLLNKGIRKSDFFARYGGEEFVMLLPETTAEQALKLANNLRENIKSCSFHYRGEDVRVTVSCGISCFSQGDTVDQVFERADRALYAAKDQGRNRCVLSAD
ncbi:MAG: GGDEF domain-containing protein [Gammaproteobacteria bacterium]|nr:GGDEF domain-containing protein [Gammaproteobacteria bacterium]MBQ0838564.1 GGDEF domain-containing protein [Gammaproteobacteria bacterium]